MHEQPLTHAPLVVGLLRPADPADDGLRLREQCKAAVEQDYNFVLLPFTRQAGPGQPAPAKVDDYRKLPPPPFTRLAHKALGSAQWRSVIGVVEALAADPDPALLEYICREAVQWARYLGLHGLLLPLPAFSDRGRLRDYGAVLARIQEETRLERLDLWIRAAPHEAGWAAWHALREGVGVTPGNKLHVVLDLEGLREEDAAWDIHWQRWFGESLRALLIPTSLYQRDYQGRPGLPGALATVVEGFMRYPLLSWIVSGPDLHGLGYRVYRDQLVQLQAHLPLSVEEVYMRPSVDQLQRPLQPLNDHLGSTSYEDFELDPVKYRRYEDAIRLALQECHARSDDVVLMVLGAGRGPLVDAAARALADFPGRARVFVIEKNPSAAVTLRHRARDDWTHLDLSVVETDMRGWETAERADIIVSELLGSWGDNELSPECLDGAQRLLKDTGISIPAEYTSHVSPIASARLHAAVASRVPPGHGQLSPLPHLETTYVVRMGAVFQLAAEQPCFHFAHPRQGGGDNARHAVLEFVLPEALEQCVVHGFRGTFDCRLYGDVVISIADHNRSEGMWCWSPLYIPLANPLSLRGGARLRVHFWRRTEPGRVWYEWQVEGQGHVHNAGGRSASIGAPLPREAVTA